tara:strand:+ start:18842 stop:19654 length:813 start_codon:yes stop_codon:yes gene_type:complete
MILKNSFNLDGKTIVITGANGLLGIEFTESILEFGGQVIAIDLASNNLENKELLENNLLHFINVDISDELELKKQINEISENLKLNITGLVNCAAKDFIPDKSDEAGTLDDLFDLNEFRKTLDLNVTSQIIVADIVAELLIKNGGGSIINISSIYGLLSPKQSIYDHIVTDGKVYKKPLSYSVSKSALFNLTRHLATLWAKNSIRVNTVTFGGVENNQDKKFIEKYSENVPVGRMADVTDYSGIIIYLLSDNSKYVTGANFVVDGGWSSW